ncbi:uncharacterized protein LOC105190291 [Harpegnathos saltator]|uniref:uncharacterized protein LOC105190291 n=1 Tax=Harpegnathos saltator TaxID=610380 RepID=UPI00058D515B|nr:uncharacterized protein LOC105190291 [Harpegnathos saltator]
MTDFNSHNDSLDMEQKTTTLATSMDTSGMATSDRHRRRATTEVAVNSQPGRNQVAKRGGLRSAKSRNAARAKKTDEGRSRSPIDPDESTSDESSGDEWTGDNKKPVGGKWDIPKKENGETDEEEFFKKATRGRGRTETTGEYRKKKEFMARNQVLLEKAKEEKLLKGLENPVDEFQTCSANRKYKAEVKRIMEEMEETSFRDISASVMEASMKVLGFSVKSKNLKGTYVKVLRDAAAAITVDTNLMANYMAKDKSGENLDVIEELKTENLNLKASLNDMKKELEEVRELLRSIKEAPSQLAVSSSPPKQHGNAGGSIKRAPQLLAGAPSPPACVETQEERMEWAKGRISPPLVDMSEEEEAPIGVIEIQKELIPKGKIHPVGKGQNDVRVAGKRNVGPKIRENVPFNNKVRMERTEEIGKKEEEGLKGKITNMVLKVLNEWTVQRTGEKKKEGKKERQRGTPNQGAGRNGNKGDSNNTGRERGTPVASQRTKNLMPENKVGTSTPENEVPWTKVLGRKEKKEDKKDQKRQETERIVKEGNKGMKERKQAKRKVPNTAAATITADKSRYKELLAEAKSKIDLTNIGIEKMRTRIGATGALVLEIPGEERGRQADILADK